MVDFTPNGQPAKFNGTNGKGRRVDKDVRELRRKVLDLKAVLVASLTPERLWLIAEQIIELAEAGNMEAATWICDRCIGKPTQATDITTQDVQSDEPAKVVILDWRRKQDAAPLESN